ncbi:MAG: hypothetical protein AVDCRST_MAG32-763 [uncultured Nocardioides sp.]|uniref:Polyketide cyclase/dehydrase n=1 Tax=uncultured Nocardioides sp. TaxID=198441 RepID=A0A6J4N0P1_9ACTN|nr:MAG: hypothetical protein AVDCRST_MAG32-763 [uncultured Nocardioides sp.]
MSTVSRTIAATPDTVWAVLADGWLYPVFVVGASRMRDVDEGWPQVGAKLHHSVGSWPALIDDNSEVLEAEVGKRLKLRVRAWPAGEGTVEFRLEPTGEGTNVTIAEDAAKGPALLLPKPVRDAQLDWRNTETLLRLAFIAENRRS